MLTKNKRIFHILLIGILGFIVYSNTFNVPFIFDDEFSITRNPVIRNLDNFFFKQEGYSDNPGRYIGFLTFAINYKLGGLNVAGYHIFNLLVHIVNTILVYIMIILTFRTPNMKDSCLIPFSDLIAIFAAVLFVAHPIQTQAVTYTVQRFASLATMFYLFAIVLYARMRIFQESGKLSSKKVFMLFFLSLAMIVLAMKTKEIAFTLPIIITLYEFFFFRSAIRKRITFLTPVILTLLIIPVGILNVHKPVGTIISDVSEMANAQASISRVDYLLTQFSVIITYIRLLFFPVNQTLDYDYPVYHSLFTPRVFISFLVLLCLFCISIFLLIRSRRGSDSGNRIIAFGMLWFFVTLSVESSVIPIADVIYEHRVYLPSIGFFVALVTFLILVKNSLEKRGLRAGYVIVPTLVMAVLTFSIAAYARNNIWKDDIRFWEDVVKKSPFKARTHSNLGVVYGRKKLFEEAIKEFQTAIRLDSFYPVAHYNLGNIYGKQGRFEEAIEELKTAIKLSPEYAVPHQNLGVIYG
ncbi:MAG: hypothetical protein A2W05_09140, partial [Candidatus Schekmanbacteria bacterium RBG_16_38_10]